MDAPLRHLLERWEDDPTFRAVLARGGDGLVLPDAIRPAFLAGLAVAADCALVAVVPSDPEAESLHAAVSEFLRPAALLGAWDVLPYEGLSPDPRISARRSEALHLLARGSGPRVVVASVRGFVQKPAPGLSALGPLRLAAGMEVDRDELAGRLASLGYLREDLAAEPGTFALRGGIVDVFPANASQPVRAELAGDEVESLRLVDPETQRSLGPAGEVWIFASSELVPSPEVRRRAAEALRRRPGLPEDATERLAKLAEGVLAPGAESVLPLLWDGEADALAALAPPGTITVLLDPLRATDEAERAVAQEEELAALWADPTRLADPSSPRPPRAGRDEDRLLTLPLQRVLEGFAARGLAVWRMGALREAQAPAGVRQFPEDAASQANAGGGDPEDALGGGLELEARAWEPGLSPHALLERCRALRREGYEVVFCAHPQETAAVGTRLADEGLGSAPVVASQLRGGFISPPMRLAVVTHTEWHARPPAPPRPRRRPRPRALDELRPGDYVVHVLHGIGRYVGMETREAGGVGREYLVLEYAGGDRLYVPSDSTDSLQRYLGSDQPRLSRLGSGDWERTKARVRRRAREIAAELIRLYAARSQARGHAYPLDSPWQRELEESFPYEETPDQLRAVEDVYRDMARPVPMDRLVCGDVGYGKTEVAVRAAFKAVTDGKQVAVLVPTTLLAQQHYATFSERLAPFPVRVAMLSRFLSPRQQEEVLAGLASGEVDVVIGTHRLLGRDVRFHDLGLVVVDEEHRFGVAQKEQLKRLRVETDVLTLTATPIPRTLEMALAGIRDLSTIETPPAERRPVRTYVGPFDERLVAAAIRRELARGGQVFYVHNRVQTIGRELRRLERLVPEARIALAHGQMDEEALEKTMLAFWNREVDVLLCTTIIEAGLDIPTCNTLIVDRADRLGLAQLYQLRGRVGRAGEQAYAYLLFPPTARMGEQAHERLKTLARYSELGSGLAIALRDLEIRGAGNLLGAEQHGHIAAVGFDLYVQILEEAARELRGEPPPARAEVRLDLPVDAYLPVTYIDREPLRLAAYRRIADTQTLEDVEDVAAELRDRYGPPPPQAAALLEVARLRAICRGLGLREVSVGTHELHGLVARLRPVRLASEWQWMRLRRRHPRSVLSEATSTLLVPLGGLEGIELVRWLSETIRDALADGAGAGEEPRPPSGGPSRRRRAASRQPAW